MDNNKSNVVVDPFAFSALFPKTNGGMYKAGVYYLDKDQWGMLVLFEQDLMNSNLILSQMAKKLYSKGVRIACVINPDLEKDAIYDTQNKKIHFKDKSGIASQRIIMHELLHAFQVHLASVKYTPENESATEFEVLLAYDVIWYMMYGGFANEGGSSSKYKSLVERIATFSWIKNPELNRQAVIDSFAEYYKDWCGVSQTTEVAPYYPSLLIYISTYKWL